MNTYLIVNGKTNTAILTNKETWDGDWKEKYPHVRKLDYLDIYTYPIYGDGYEINDVAYVYDLCCDGGIFTLLNYKRKSRDYMRKTILMLKHSQDVVSVRVKNFKLIGEIT
jgi:hypothetical protein